MRIIKILARLILGLILAITAIVVAGWLFYQVTYHDVEWPTTQGTIRSSEIGYDREPPISRLFSSQDWLVTVSFEYEVQGIRYSWYQQWYESKTEAEKKQLQYSPGSNVTIHYNPKIPTIAVVDPGKRMVSRPDLIYLLFLIPALVGGLTLIFFASRDILRNIRSRGRSSSRRT